MTDILAVIDAATAGLCNCGAEPAPGSAYCGDDCRPTHMARDSDDSPAGSHDTATPMRWRPDLVTAADDADLIPLGSTTYYTGRFNAQLFDRRSRRDVWHLRLDDGHRFVGADLEGLGESIDDDLHRRVGETWATLERELGNTRHLVADDDPWADAMSDRDMFVAAFNRAHHRLAETAQRRQATWSAAWEAAFRATQGMADTIDSPLRIAPPLSYHDPSIRIRMDASRYQEQMNAAVETATQQVRIHLTNWQRDMVERMANVQSGARLVVGRHDRWLPDEVWAAAVNRSALPVERVHVAGYCPTADPDEPPADPMARALWLRKRRNTGPGPDRLDGRRGRRR
jgi:hypothetical protein